MKVDLHIEFTKPKGHPLPLISKAIQLVEGTEYSHVRIRWVDKHGRNIVYEAAAGRVDFVGEIAQEDRPVHLVKAYKIKVVDQSKLVSICLKYAGVDYSQSQLVGILLVRMFNLKKNPLSQGKKGQVCSEIVARILEDIKGWDVDMDLDIAGPKEIDQMLARKVEQGLCEVYIA